MFPQKSEETNTVLIINGLANQIVALSTSVISQYSQLFRVLSTRMRSGWCPTCIFLHINLWRIYTNFQWALQKQSRHFPWWENPRLDLLCVLSPVRSAFLPTIEKSQKPKESESALLHTATLDNMKTRCEVAVARGFLRYGLLNCFLTSTRCHFWQNIIMFKSRETP